MTRAWIEEGLRHSKEREEARQHVLDRRQQQHRLILEQGPSTMRALVDELAASVDEFRRVAPQLDRSVVFERLPRGGFLASRSESPRVFLQGRPDYADHVVTCNWTHPGEDDTEMVEVPFNLHFTVNEADQLALRHGSRSFSSLAELAEFLLTPVLFPELK